MSSESEYSACSDKGEVEIGSEDSMDDLNSEDDYYVDDETGDHVTADQIRNKDKEAFDELHRILYGPNFAEDAVVVHRKPKAAKTEKGSRKKRPAHDSGSDTEELSDVEKPKKAKKARISKEKHTHTKSREKSVAAVKAPSRSTSRAKKVVSRSKETIKGDLLL